MDDYTATAHLTKDEVSPCNKRFLLGELTKDKRDKLGNRVEQILWVGKDYAVYRSEKGVYVQFSDCPKREALQRRRFAEICPELCELRYLTYQIRSGWYFPFKAQTRSRPSSLYDYNIAQALMLVMEKKVDLGKQLAQKALDMAVQRVTNDNSVRYLCFCLLCWVVCIATGAGLKILSSPQLLWPYSVAGMCGATGAVLSVATRLQTFELRPCNQSNMNYWMSGTRVGIGVVAGAILVLLAPTILTDTMKKLVPQMGETVNHWETAAVLGLIGGFAERLIPNLLWRTVRKVESSFGTPAQAVRSEAQDRNGLRAC
jgi:hypothetical protein